MKKYRLFAAIALLALPSMIFSTAGHSTSRLPEIGTSTQQFGRQSCPTGSEQGCFGSGVGVGGNGMIAAIFASADHFRRERINTCVQFIQRIQSFGTEPG